MRVTQINYVFISYIVLHVIIYLFSLQITVLMVIILELWINVVVPVNKLYQQISQNVIENGLDHRVVGRVQKYHQVSKVSFHKDEICIKMCLFYLHRYYPCHMLLIELLGPSRNSSSLPVDRKYQKRQSRDNYIILLGTDHLTCRRGTGFFFVQNFFFGQHESQNIFFVAQSVNFFSTI